MRLTLHHFGIHDDSVLDTPDNGVVLLLGGNGEGKSLVSEALVWCLWADSVRASRRDWSPAREDTEVTLEVGGHVYTRKASSRGRGSRFTVDGEGSTSDSNRVVIDRFGSSRYFLTSSVFHRARLVSFTNATDSERKELMEYLLGVSDFQSAWKQAKAELSTVEENILQATRELVAAKSRVSYCEGQLDHMRSPTKPRFTRVVKQAKKLLKRPLLEGPERPSHEKYSSTQRILTEAQRDLAHVDNDLARVRDLIESGKCSTCGADTKRLGPELDDLKKTRARYLGLVKAAREARDKEDKERAANDKKYQLALEEYHAARMELSEAVGVVGEYERQYSTYMQASADYDQARFHTKLDLSDFRASLRACELKITSLRARERRLHDLIQIYGPRGARLMMLLGAFDSLGTVASSVLAKLYGKKVLVQITPSQDLTKVTLSVVLRGQTLSYRALSEGEKSLVDFALLKALATIPGVLGAPVLPVIYDDILDAMDKCNSERVQRFIQSEASDRLVMVLSHDEDLADSFPGSTVYHVDDGTLRRIA